MHIYGMHSYNDSQSKCLIIGILQGGGSLLGADNEQLVSNQYGVQFGMGLFGYGAGINYHFRETIRSPLLSLQYIHQGLMEHTPVENINANIAMTYVFRTRRRFTFQIGVGYSLDPHNRDWTFQSMNALIMMIYFIGAYAPF